MEVRRGNFREVMLELENVIQAAEFLAIDGDYTVPFTAEDVNAFDTLLHSYPRLRTLSIQILLVRFGLCAFSYNKEEDKYTHRAYNFYIFPQTQVYLPPKKCWIESTTWASYISQGFGFDMLRTEGISYLSQPEEQKLRDHLESCNNTNTSSNGAEEDSGPECECDEYVSRAEVACSRIKTFLERSEAEELELGRLDELIRKLITRIVAQRFDQNAVLLETRVKGGNKVVLYVTRCGSPEERKKKEKETIDKALGFSLLFRMISESGKLVIGHGMLQTICLVINQCCSQLPSDCTEFKDTVNRLFSKLIDTRCMSHSPPFRHLISSDILVNLYETLSGEPFKMCMAKCEQQGRGYSTLGHKYEVAAYRAYIAGLCFITMANYLGSQQNPKVYPVLPSSQLLDPYLSKWCSHFMAQRHVCLRCLSGS